MCYSMHLLSEKRDSTSRHEEVVSGATSHTAFLFSTAVVIRSVWCKPFTFIICRMYPSPLPQEACFLHTSASCSPCFLESGGRGTKNSRLNQGQSDIAQCPLPRKIKSWIQGWSDIGLYTPPSGFNSGG